jgi:putative transposase
LNRSTAYYRFRQKDETNLRIKDAIDKQYVQTPFYGVPRMTAHLRRDGFNVNPKGISRIMRGMGLMAIYPRRRSLSRSEQSHPEHPYLLKGTAICRPDNVWASDITYIRLRGGFVYLTAIMDWHSRFVLSWELSNTLDAGFCVSALDKALTISRPKIFNWDQGKPIHASDVLGAARAGWGPDKHEWSRACFRQHFRGAALAEREIRRCVSEGLCERDLRSGEPGGVLSVLQ